MWNVYADVNGNKELQAKDCYNEETAWSVIHYMEEMEHYPFPLWAEFAEV